MQNYQTQEEIKHCLAITLFLKMLQDFMAAAYTCRPQITAKKYTGGRDMPKHITSDAKPLRTSFSFKDFNILKSLAPSARSFFNFMTTCYFPCLHVT